MTDDLDALARALKADLPPPDAEKRRHAILMAEKNFDDIQGNASDARPIHEPTGIGAFGKRIVLDFIIYCTSSNAWFLWNSNRYDLRF